MFVDARIPVVFGVQPGPGDHAWRPQPDVPHPAGCACCVARSPLAAGLDLLFLQRVRGEIPWFSRVVITQDDPALRSAIASDPVLTARFRLA